MYVCWYQEVVCVFWGGFGQDWGFDVLEVGCVQMVVQCLYQFDVGVLYMLYFWVVQVQVVVFQVGFFVWVFVGVEWQWFGFVEDGDGCGDYFYVVGVEFVVDCMVGMYYIFYLQYVFIVKVGGYGEYGCVVDFYCYLYDVFMIVQIDEVYVVLIVGNVGLVGKGNGLVNQGFVDQVIEVGMYGGKVLQESVGIKLCWKVCYFVVVGVVG